MQAAPAPALGALITTDEQTVVFLLMLNDQSDAPFVIKQLDKLNLFVKQSAIARINAALTKRLADSVYVDEEADG